MPVPSRLTWLQREALRLTSERQEVRRGDFMARCGISREVARRELAGLVKAGKYPRVEAVDDETHEGDTGAHEIGREVREHDVLGGLVSEIPGRQ